MREEVTAGRQIYEQAKWEGIRLKGYCQRRTGGTASSKGLLVARRSCEARQGWSDGNRALEREVCISLAPV